jgi:uncharacterized protein YgiM (DUF1202 family)
VKLINQERTARDHRNVLLDKDLNELALVLAQEGEGYTGSEGTRPSGLRWNSIFIESGLWIEPGSAGYIEYAARTQMNAQQLYDEWMETEGKWQVLMSGYANRCGLAEYHSEQDGKYYYVMLFAKKKAGAKPELPPVNAELDIAAALRDTLVHSGPDDKHVQAGTLKKGQRIGIHAIRGRWAEVDWYGQHGYILNEDLQRAVATASSAPAAGTAVTLRSATSLRNGPGNAYTKLTPLRRGYTVTLNALLGGNAKGWAKVIYNGRRGYVPLRALNLPAGLEMDVQAEVAKEGALGQATALRNTPVRVGPGTRYRPVAQLKKGAQIAVEAVEGEWARVNWYAADIRTYALLSHLEMPEAPTAE